MLRSWNSGTFAGVGALAAACVVLHHVRRRSWWCIPTSLERTFLWSQPQFALLVLITVNRSAYTNTLRSNFRKLKRPNYQRFKANVYSVNGGLTTAGGNVLFLVRSQQPSRCWVSAVEFGVRETRYQLMNSITIIRPKEENVSSPFLSSDTRWQTDCSSNHLTSSGFSSSKYPFPKHFPQMVSQMVECNKPSGTVG